MMMCGVTEHRLGVEEGVVNMSTIGGGLLREVHAFVSQDEADFEKLRYSKIGSFTSSDHVRLHGLSAPGMNGLVGVVVEERTLNRGMTSTGRWAVHLPPSAGADSRTVAIKTKNLTIVPHVRGNPPQSFSENGDKFQYNETVYFMELESSITGPPHLKSMMANTVREEQLQPQQPPPQPTAATEKTVGNDDDVDDTSLPPVPVPNAARKVLRGRRRLDGRTVSLEAPSAATLFVLLERIGQYEPALVALIANIGWKSQADLICDEYRGEFDEVLDMLEGERTAHWMKNGSDPHFTSNSGFSLERNLSPFDMDYPGRQRFHEGILQFCCHSADEQDLPEKDRIKVWKDVVEACPEESEQICLICSIHELKTFKTDADCESHCKSWPHFMQSYYGRQRTDPRLLCVDLNAFNAQLDVTRYFQMQDFVTQIQEQMNEMLDEDGWNEKDMAHLDSHIADTLEFMHRVKYEDYAAPMGPPKDMVDEYEEYFDEQVAMLTRKHVVQTFIEHAVDEWKRTGFHTLYDGPDTLLFGVQFYEPRGGTCSGNMYYARLCEFLDFEVAYW